MPVSIHNFFVVEKLNKHPTCEVKSTSQFALGNEMSSFRLKIELDSRKHNRYSIELSVETRLKVKRLFYAFVNTVNTEKPLCVITLRPRSNDNIKQMITIGDLLHYKVTSKKLIGTFSIWINLITLAK